METHSKEIEIWKNCSGYENYYECSSFGNIRSKARIIVHSNGSVFNKKPITLKPGIGERGYYHVTICILEKNIRVSKRKCRLIAKTFINNPFNLPDVNHKDGNKFNDAVSNLEWCTKSYNQLHRYRVLNKAAPSGINCHISKFSAKQINEIRNSNISQGKLSSLFNVSQSVISEIKNFKTYKNVKND